MEPSEKVQWSRSTALTGIEVLGVTNCVHGWNIYHERYAICACSKGAASWHYRGQCLYYEEQRIGFMEPGEVHTTPHVYLPGDFEVLLADPGVVKAAAEDLGIQGDLHFKAAQVADPLLFTALRGLSAAVAADETPLEQQTWLTLCLHGMLGNVEQDRPPRSRAGFSLALKRAMEFLREHFREPIDLEHLSMLTGLSRFTLVHAFTRQVGMPPHAYQNHIRIERARALLDLGLPLAMVAAEVGFADQSHLNRHFKRIMRVTPGHYANSPLRPPSLAEPAPTH